MKVKELAEIFKTSVQELLNILPNVGIDTSNGEETFVEKDVEKKLAKRYNIPYPFKTAKPKVAPKPVVNVAAKAAQKQNEQKVATKPVAKETVKPVAKRTLGSKVSVGSAGSKVSSGIVTTASLPCVFTV